MNSTFICDVHIPPRLAIALRASGFEAVHVLDIGLEAADDIKIWNYARTKDAIVVTKDRDFIALASIEGTPRIILIRLGNCSNRRLQEKFFELLPGIQELFDSGQQLVELA